MPTPSSSTAKVTVADSARAETVTVPPRSVKRIALDTRLSRICCTARLSATMSGSSAEPRLSRRTPRLACAQGQKVAAGRDHFRRRKGLGRDREIAGLDLRHIENAVDHRQ